MRKLRLRDNDSDVRVTQSGVRGLGIERRSVELHPAGYFEWPLYFHFLFL